MQKPWFSVVASLAAVLSVEAYDATGYVTFDGDTINKTWSFNPGGGGDASPTYKWSDGLAPTAGKKYLVNTGTLYTRNDTTATYTFPGDVLAVSKVFWPRDLKSSIPCFHLLNGGEVTYAATGRYLIDSAVTNYATTTPFKFRTTATWASGAQKIFFSNVSFAGASDTKMTFSADINGTLVFVFDAACDASQDFGTWAVANSGASASTRTEMNFADISFGGTLDLGDRAQVVASGTTGPGFAALVVRKGGRILLSGRAGLAVGNLTLEDGAIIEVPTDFSGAKGVTVSGNLTVSGQVRVLTSKSFAAGAPNVSQIIRLGDTAAGTLDPSQFTVESDPFKVDASLTYNAADKALDLRFVEVVTKDAADTSDATSCFLEANKTVWSNDELPDASHIYYAGKHVYMPAGASVFPGRTLVLAADLRGTAAKGTCTVNDFRWYADTYVEYFYYSGFWLCGKLTTTRKKSNGSDGPTISVFLRNDAFLGIASEISGDADLRFKVGYSDKNYIATPKARYAFTGLNTNFTGKMLFTCPSPVYQNESDAKAGANPLGPNATYCAKVWAWNERNFGGPLATFRYDALELQYWSVLNVTNDLVFCESSRGLKVTGYGRFSVDAGRTLTITNKQVTYAGTFAKEGPGTLVLGGTAKFLDGTYDTPFATDTVLTGTNVLSVQAGALEVVDATATRNLAVEFASGASLKVRAGATADHALDVTGVGAGLTAPAGGVSVTFDVADATPGPFSAVICTAIRDDLSFALPRRVSSADGWRAYRPRLVKTTEGGGDDLLRNGREVRSCRPFPIGGLRRLSRLPGSVPAGFRLPGSVPAGFLGQTNQPVGQPRCQTMSFMTLVSTRLQEVLRFCRMTVDMRSQKSSGAFAFVILVVVSALTSLASSVTF